VVNVLRKFGGRVEARNDAQGGGAQVQLILPLSALAIAANEDEEEPA